MALVTVQRSPTPSATSSPCVSEAGSGEEDWRSQPRSISESFLTVKGAAVFLPRGNGSSPSSVPRITQRWNKHAGDLQQHLQTMFMLLRPEDTIRLAVRLESVHPQCTRYMVVVSTNGRQDTEESVVLGMDFSSSNGSCSVGLVLPLWSDTLIHLDGDGGFSVSTVNRVHVFKPVSVQAMWSALQSLHKACEVARCHNYYPGSLFLTWVSYYQSRVTSDQACINEWNAMRDVQSHRSDSPVLFTDVPTERERTERLIKMRLREIMMQKDLENVTSKEIRNELEMQMVCNLREFKEFIDNEMIVILGQMDSPTEIFDHVYLGSEWNASNLEELQTSGVRYILNVTREIDNFFPGLFEYHNIRVYDEEATNLLEYWNDTYKFISKAKKAGAKCLVHCKMGVSRSASTVIAYAMKEYGWDLERAFDHVKERRAVTKPNPSFMRQLEEYQGILLASKQRHNKLWRSHSDSDLSERHEPLCKTPHTLGRSDPHNNNSNPPSLQQFLGMAVLQALAVDKEEGLLDARGNESPATEVMPGVCMNFLESSCLDISEETLPSPASPSGRCLHLPPAQRLLTTTMVPEESTDDSPVTVHPNSSPSLHIPTASSSESILESLELHITSAGCSQPSTYVPEQNLKPVCLPWAAPHTKSSEPLPEASKLRASGLCDLSALAHDCNRNDSLPFPSQDSNSNNNPNTTELDSVHLPTFEVDSSSLNTDSINFFSARDKFLELSQDGGTRLLSESVAPQTPHANGPRLDLQPLCLEEPCGFSSTDDQVKKSPQLEETRGGSPRVTASSQPYQANGVSVRHIVTELESISQAVPFLCHTSLMCSQQEVAREEELSMEEPETRDGFVSNPLPSPSTQSLSMPPTDWPSGSVRRVTKQLEQRLRQELDSSLPSTSCQQFPPTSSRGHPNCGEGLVTVQQEEEQQRGGDDHKAEEEHGDDGRAFSGERVGLPVQSLIHAPNTNSPEPDPLPSVVNLQGVTELETDTEQVLDCKGGAELLGKRAHSSQDLEKIQETLRELQAFLSEAGGHERETEGLAGERVCPQSSEEVVSSKATLQRNVSELDARIRQAGLTPPSLMKRSASLAKLDRLELSTSDLSNWDFSPPPTPNPEQPPLASASQPHPIQDDATKKQRVLPSQPPSLSVESCTLEDCSKSVGSHLGDPEPKADSSLVRSAFSSDLPCRDGGGAQDAQVATLPVSLATRQQQGKIHYLRRLRKPGEKRRTAAFLYNTM
ncbi:protein phosphatase Slingshot homolog 2-like isoform X2 [Scleropages formosus]|uniref:protein-serine/threonine phosphatase n=1 Tax=Scleropages formosus TaxID=113540 RepID=A0A8C9RA76_SCLFO|nr:protein phosphatase Slingshot homolog 2-like isoform X2 [Scleropages formosus]